MFPHFAPRRCPVALAIIIAILGPIAVALTAPPARAEPGEHWTPTGRTAPAPGTQDPTRQRRSTGGYDVWTLQLDELRRELAATSADDEVRVALPRPDGELETFAVRRTTVLADGLAAARPDIVTMGGTSVDNPGVRVRLDLTNLGLRAYVRAPGQRSWYVEPQSPGDAEQYVSLASADLAAELPRLEYREDAEQPEVAEDEAGAAPAPGAVPLRTYRIALLSDVTYAEYVGQANVVDAKASLINRVNDIYETDLGTRFVLVDGTEKLSFATEAEQTGANGPCGAQPCFTPAQVTACSSGTLNRNTAVINAMLGNDDYEIGHIALGRNGGGIARLWSVGDPAVKGAGCTGLTRPVGDYFAVDYVAHEIGHQFGGYHTFAGCGGNSDPNRLEPGSGSSIMAYAGICGADNLQQRSDPYFLGHSIRQIARFQADGPPSSVLRTRGDGSRAAAPGTEDLDAGSEPPPGGWGYGGQVSHPGNAYPTVSAGADRVIPARTPFTLTAQGSDPDGDELTYLWEQNDSARSPLPTQPKTAGPLFRQFGVANTAPKSPSDYYDAGLNAATGDPSRTFPDLAQVLAGNTNAETGRCPVADASAPTASEQDCLSEYLPTADYVGNAGDAVLNFRVSARDSAGRAGGVAFAETRVRVDTSTGPFRVTSQAANHTVRAGGQGVITWEVNGTDAPELAERVRITLSRDGGKTFDVVLAESVPNSGRARITWPTTDLADARIMVSAVDNVFFDVNDSRFAIQRR